MVVGALAWSAASRVRGVRAACVVDERAGLRETLSTALCVERSGDPWAQAVIESARARAAGLKVSRVIPWAAPRRWPVSLVIALSFAAVWFIWPVSDVLGLRDAEARQEQRAREIVRVTSEIQTQERKLTALLEQAGVTPPGESPAPPDLAPPEDLSPEALRRAAVKRLTDVAARLEEKRAGEPARTLDALAQSLRKLRQPGPGPLEELSRQLARGEFGKAQEELGELARQLGAGSLSDEQKAQLSKQLADLGKQLERLAQDRAALERALEQAGLDKSEVQRLAQDPAALRQALDALQGLTPEQKQHLLNMARSQMQSGQQCQRMGSQLSRMAEGMSPSGMDAESLQAMEALAGQLDELEMMAAEMQSLDAAMSECASQLSELGKSLGAGEGDAPSGDRFQVGEWEPGDGRQLGWGSGGPGVSQGGVGVGEQHAPFSLEKRKERAANVGGATIGTRLVYGEQVRGESTAGFEQAVEAGAQAAADAIDNQLFDRSLHDPIKRYFGRLQEQAKKPRDAEPPVQDEGSDK